MVAVAVTVVVTAAMVMVTTAVPPERRRLRQPRLLQLDRRLRPRSHRPLQQYLSFGDRRSEA